MHYYGMSKLEVENLPIRTFWFFSDCVDRIEAQRNMRGLSVINCGQSAESSQQLRDKLVMEIGTLIEAEKEPDVLDSAGLAELKAMADS